MKYFYLVLAIFLEVTATTFMKQSDGFTKLTPSIITVLGYVFCFYFLSLAIRDLPTGIVYATWSGVGIILIAAAAWFFQGQRLDVPAVVGMTLIILGVLVMNLFSKTSVH